MATTTIEATGLATLSGGISLGSGKQIGDTFISGGTVTAAASLPLALTGFNSYWLRISNCDPVTANQALEIQFSADGGATWGGSTSYDYAGLALSTAGGAPTDFNGAGTASILVSSLGLGATSGFNQSVDIRINCMAGVNPIALWDAWLSDQTGNIYSVRGGGRSRTTSADHVRLIFTSGNIATIMYALSGLQG